MSQANPSIHLPARGLKLDTLHLGSCYYPEHRTDAEIVSDIERMAAAGFTMIRLGEGAWWYWEPEEGKFQFDVFDRTIELCGKHGIKVFMGTPTYACPAWVATKYPEILRWDFDRTPMKHGSRRNLNYTSPKYYELSDILCNVLADHYRGNPHIIGWQLDNEFNCHMDVSYAPSDTKAFRVWLKEKYRTLDQLNDAWGTKFWSQVYSDWEQIDLPQPTATYLNPSQLLDESRFISDCVVKFAARQADILRAADPKWLITHNSIFANVDGPALVSKLDFFSLDHYPLFYSKWSKAILNHIRFRSFSFPYGIMEHQSGPGGQMSYFHRTGRPNELRLWSWQSIAHGSKFINYFLWHTCAFGSEQHWHGLIDQDNRDTRRLVEAKAVGQEAKKIAPEFFDAPVTKTFAVLENFLNEVHDYRINTYTRVGNGENHRWLAQLAEHHYPADIVWEESDWNDYRFIIASHLRILTPSIAAKMRQYVENGGILILGARTGVYDDHVHVVEKILPGLALDLAGAEVEEWTSVPEKETFDILLNNGVHIPLGVFADCLKPTTAEVVGTWKTEDLLLTNRPAVTRNKLGKGEVWYIAGYCQDSAMNSFISYWKDLYQLKPLVEASDMVEAIERTSGNRRWTILLNHSSRKETVLKVPQGKELLSGKSLANSSLELDPYGVAIIESAA